MLDFSLIFAFFTFYLCCINKKMHIFSMNELSKYHYKNMLQGNYWMV